MALQLLRLRMEDIDGAILGERNSFSVQIKTVKDYGKLIFQETLKKL